MNLRNRFLSSKIYNFEETQISLHGNSVYKLMNFPLNIEKLNKFSKLEVFLGLTNEPLIFLNDLKLNETRLNPDFLIFASRHTSKTAQPAFLVHTTGNWTNNADFGGDPQDLSVASALLLKAGFMSLLEKDFSLSLSDFTIEIEVTHHGPTVLKVPLIFIELGSSKTEWEISEAGESVANAIISTIVKFLDYRNSKNQEIGLGFGGTHYAPNFHRLIENNDIAMSFICPKYYIKELNVELIYKMVNNTIEPVDYFIIDWKGTNSEDKKHLIPILEEFEIPIRKTKDF
ncbi:MAG: D-aminoacyl-tRNA deacylase [Candidatus Lokiarchaeota archaeon]|nr:D-aminoacyl-tRNA deacylase [Candidatus Lokiarchaeota archaeon]